MCIYTVAVCGDSTPKFVEYSEIQEGHGKCCHVSPISLCNLVSVNKAKRWTLKGSFFPLSFTCGEDERSNAGVRNYYE